MRRAALFSSAALLLLASCRSYHIDATVENRTGAPIRLLEVDYPYASFGVNALASGEDFRYRFTVTGDGPLRISYTAQDGKEAQITGPALANRQQGRMEIILLPGGKADFRTQLKPGD
jgi:hypothetical protein